jgi:hypothetical protein
MKTQKIILITSIGVVTLLLIISFYNGIFDKVKINEESDGGYILAGMDFKGPYSKAGKYVMEVGDKLKKYEISSSRQFGVYYDNPDSVKPENCRSFIGSIIERNDTAKISELKSAGFKLDTIPVQTSLQAVFPIKNSFSYMVGPWKVYPALSKYMKERNYTTDLTMEIYDNNKKEIIFLIQYH